MTIKLPGFYIQNECVPKRTAASGQIREDYVRRSTLWGLELATDDAKVGEWLSDAMSFADANFPDAMIDSLVENTVVMQAGEHLRALIFLTPFMEPEEQRLAGTIGGWVWLTQMRMGYYGRLIPLGMLHIFIDEAPDVDWAPRAAEVQEMVNAEAEYRGEMKVTISQKVLAETPVTMGPGFIPELKAA